MRDPKTVDMKTHFRLYGIVFIVSSVLVGRLGGRPMSRIPIAEAA